PDDRLIARLNSFPPGFGVRSVADVIASQRTLPIVDLTDTSLPGRDSLELRVRCGTDRAETVRASRDLWGIHVIERARLRSPLPELRRAWTGERTVDDVERSLVALEPR